MIAYSPIDLRIDLPNEEVLYNYCVSNTFSKSPNLDNGIICIVGSKSPLTDWRTILDSYEGRIYDEESEPFWQEQYDRLHAASNSTEYIGQIFFEPKFKEQFPSLVDACLQLPFKFLTGIFLLLAGNRGTTEHRDPPPMKDDPTQQTEIVPNRYNISLNCFDNPKFYVVKEDGSDKTYMKVTKEYPCFAFNNRDYLHGADLPDEHTTRRMQLLVYGVLDDAKHQELIDKSISKFYG